MTTVRHDQRDDKPARGRAVLYPDHYAWYLLGSALDIVVTTFILEHMGLGNEHGVEPVGREVNVLAARLIDVMGIWGLIALKFSTVIVVILVCETVGRRRPRLGRALATTAVVLSALPVGLGLLQAWAWTRGLM